MHRWLVFNAVTVNYSIWQMCYSVTCVLNWCKGILNVPFVLRGPHVADTSLRSGN